MRSLVAILAVICVARAPAAYAQSCGGNSARSAASSQSDPPGENVRSDPSRAGSREHVGNHLTYRQPGEGVLAATDYGAADYGAPEPLTVVGVALGACAIAYAAWRARRKC